MTGTYTAQEKRAWADFRIDYETKIAAQFDGPSRRASRMSLNAFERLAKPKLVIAITTDLIDQFVAKRLQGK